MIMEKYNLNPKQPTTVIMGHKRNIFTNSLLSAFLTLILVNVAIIFLIKFFPSLTEKKTKLMYGLKGFNSIGNRLNIIYYRI